MKDDLQKSDSCGLKSERKKIPTSSTCSLACLSTNLGAFCPMVVHLPSENRFSHIFPAPGGLPFLTVILTVKLARLLWPPVLVSRLMQRVSGLSRELKIISVVPMKTQVLQGAGSADTLPMRFGCPAALAVLLILLPVP